MWGHIIVYGADALAERITEELSDNGATVLPLKDPRMLDHADVQSATAVVCAGADDAVNLEIALLARQLSPRVRVVARLRNDVLRDALGRDNGPGAILDVADLAAPSVVEACLSRTTHSISVADIDFVVFGADAPREATLREIYGDLAPVAVIHRDSSVTACPGRDAAVHEGDWTAMIGTADELVEQGVVVSKALNSSRLRLPMIRRWADAVRALRDDINPMFYRALGVSMTLLLGSTVLLRFAYRHPPGMGWIDALYFSTETIATVGYGDFSFMQQATWLRIWGIALMFAGVTTTAILVAFIADLLLSRRLAQSAARRRVHHLHNHIVVVGLGSFGIRVVSDLVSAGYDVAVIERDEDNRFLPTARRLDVPVIFGDATLRETLESARVGQARAVAVLTDNDMVNIETGIVLREDAQHKPVMLRVYDRVLGAAVAQRFGFENVRSTVELAAPWFIGAALGLHVVGTFSVGRHSFMVGGVFVAAGSALDGVRMADMSTKTRVIAVTRPGVAPRLHPRRDARLAAGDTAYLVGPYHELLDTLGKGKAAT